MALQGRGFGVFSVSEFTLQGKSMDQLLVIVQALNVTYALSFKGHESNDR